MIQNNMKRFSNISEQDKRPNRSAGIRNDRLPNDDGISKHRIRFNASVVTFN